MYDGRIYAGITLYSLWTDDQWTKSDRSSRTPIWKWSMYGLRWYTIHRRERTALYLTGRYQWKKDPAGFGSRWCFFIRWDYNSRNSNDRKYFVFRNYCRKEWFCRTECDHGGFFTKNIKNNRKPGVCRLYRFETDVILFTKSSGCTERQLGE